MSRHTFNTLVLSGGGTKGVMQLAALHELQSQWKDTVKLVVGTSVGALIGLFIVLGYTPAEIDQRFLTPQVLSHFRRDRVVWTDAFKQLSLFSWNLLEELIRYACMEKLHYVPTLSELVKLTHGKQLVVTTWNLDRQCTEYLSADTHSDMCVIQAMRMATAIWFVFPKVVYNGQLYIDGGIGDFTPWRYIALHAEHSQLTEEPRTLICEMPSSLMEKGSSPILSLMLSGIYANQIDNEVLAMSILKPHKTMWIKLVCTEHDGSFDTMLAIDPIVHDQHWNQGKSEGRTAYSQWVEENTTVEAESSTFTALRLRTSRLP